ncbi:HrcA family transcriptional regulator, partial [Staphylococcus aureus]
RQMTFVTLSADKALAVLVGEDGSVENRVIDIPLGLPPSALVEAGNYMSAMLGGLTLSEARARIEREMADERAALDGAARTLV